MLADEIKNIGSGNITAGIKPEQSILSVVEFIEGNFTEFTEKVKGEVTSSEKALTDKLCIFLNRKAFEYPFYFQHEKVEDHNSGTSPQTDLGTISYNENLIVGDRHYGEFDSFFAIEAKRLPTPGQTREKEYVIGHERPCGGIERFKKEIHGKNLKYAAIIGYIQKGNSKQWLIKINDWIGELMSSNPTLWKHDDLLVNELIISPVLTRYCSKNYRVKAIGKNDFIELFHFWINIIDN